MKINLKVSFLEEPPNLLTFTQMIKLQFKNRIWRCMDVQSEDIWVWKPQVKRGCGITNEYKEVIHCALQCLRSAKCEFLSSTLKLPWSEVFWGTVFLKLTDLVFWRLTMFCWLEACHNVFEKHIKWKIRHHAIINFQAQGMPLCLTATHRNIID